MTPIIFLSDYHDQYYVHTLYIPGTYIVAFCISRIVLDTSGYMLFLSPSSDDLLVPMGVVLIPMW